VELGKGNVAENGDIVVPGKGGKPGRTYPASAVARVETRDGQTAWRRTPHTPISISKPTAQSPATSSQESPRDVRSDATVPKGREAPRGPIAPRVPNATNTPLTPQAADVPEGGFATLENGSRVAFGPGAVSENGDIVVPGKGGKPGRTIPASKIVRVETPDGRHSWRRPPKGNTGGSPSSMATIAPDAGPIPSTKAAKPSRVQSRQEQREAARARIAAAETELRRLNAGLSQNADIRNNGLTGQPPNSRVAVDQYPSDVAAAHRSENPNGYSDDNLGTVDGGDDYNPTKKAIRGESEGGGDTPKDNFPELRSDPVVSVPRAALPSGSFEEAAALQSRAKALHDTRGAKQGTTSVMGVQNRLTGERQTWVAIDSDQLTIPRRWQGQLLPHERFIGGPGHAEQKILSNLGDEWYVVSGGTSVNICKETCMPLLQQHGLQLGGPLFKTSTSRNTGYRMFWGLK